MRWASMAALFLATNCCRLWPHLIALKVLAFVMMAFQPLNLPHLWRQIDTLGVGMRYYLRWARGFDQFSLLPAVLNSGNFVGFMGMELPLLNIATAPLFIAGPEWGTRLAILGVIALNFALWGLAWRIWKSHEIVGVDMGEAIKWLPLLGLSAVYMGRFIPDTPAMFLALIGVGLLSKNCLSPWGILALSLGTLMKPPVFLLASLLFLGGKDPRVILKFLIGPTIAFALTVGYYLVLVPRIDAIEANQPLFFTSLRNPVDALLGFFTETQRIFRLGQSLVFPGGVISGILVLALSLRFRPQLIKEALLPLGIVLSYILGIAALDGAHSFTHSYYHMCAMPIVSLLFVTILRRSPAKDQHLYILAHSLFVLSFIVFQITRFTFDNRYLLSRSKQARGPDFKVCQELKDKTPALPWHQNYVFRSNSSRAYPLLGLCFGERTGSTDSRYALLLASEANPRDCKIIARAKHIKITDCE